MSEPVFKVRAAKTQLWLCASCAPKGVEQLSLGRPLGVCCACGQVTKEPACVDLETLLVAFAATYQRGYGDCAELFIAAIVESAKVCAAQARLAEAAGDARRLAELLGGAEALLAFAKGFAGGARG